MEGIQKVYDFLEKAGTFYLATVEGDQPRVRPYGAMLFFKDKIYIMAFGKTNATRQIAANPKAEICAFKGQIRPRMRSYQPKSKGSAGAVQR